MHRAYAVGMALVALSRRGIPACARGLRHGSLLAFWGPYVPIEIFVPEAEAVEAEVVLRTLLVTPGATPPSPPS